MEAKPQLTTNEASEPVVRCPRCGARGVAPQVDSATGKTATADGKLILRCRVCDDVQIVPAAGWDAVRGRSRSSAYLRVGFDAVGAFVSLAVAAANWLVGFWIPWQVAVAFAAGFGLLGAAEVILQRGLLLRRYGLNNRRLDENLGALLLILLMIAFGAFALWMGNQYDPRRH